MSALVARLHCSVISVQIFGIKILEITCFSLLQAELPFIMCLVVLSLVVEALLIRSDQIRVYTVQYYLVKYLGFNP